MSDQCCSLPPSPGEEPGRPPAGHPASREAYRRVLWTALWVNALMFVVEVVAGAGARSSALHADALDFLADAGNYAISLFVLSSALQTRARAALLKGLTMAGFGVWVVGSSVYRLAMGGAPEPLTMGVVGMLALAANLGVAVLLFRYRRGDSNMRSVWLCTRNDAIGNVAVALAAVGVFTTRAGWPDALVALVMAGLALSGAAQIVRKAARELRAPAAHAAPPAAARRSRRPQRAPS